MPEALSDIGMMGLGVMGRSLALNIADRGFSVVVSDRTPSKRQQLLSEAGGRVVREAESLEQLAGMLRAPRAVMVMVTAGPPVDAVISNMLPYLEPGDLIIDGGNSHFTDTNVRAQGLAQKGVLLLGVGISGGEQGARFGPSMMPGGPREAYERVRPIFEAIAAKANGEPCVRYMGPGSAGHYVKMVHNGIEYGLMQLIAETYELMGRGLGLTDDELHSVYTQWNEGELNSFLIEITAEIFLRVDEQTGRRLIDVILDEAKQKGTGGWASQDAVDLQVPIPTIDAAVSARNLSSLKEERERASEVLKGPALALERSRDEFIERIRRALYAAVIMTYGQGFALLTRASLDHGYGLNLEDISAIWRAGCIIRSALLERIRVAYREDAKLPNLLVSALGNEVAERQADLREVVSAAASAGIPVPALMASLAYFDGYRSAWVPANLIQAQRDFFGAHTYERVDAMGVFHTHWEQDQGGDRP